MEYNYYNLNQTGRKILDAATKVFIAKGFNGATTSEIAKEAGVAEGTIFKYFNTKKELFLSLFVPVTIDEMLPDILQSLEDTFENMKNESEEEVIKAVFQNRLELFRKNSNLFQLFFYEAQFHEEIRDLLINKIVIKAKRIFTDYIEDRKSRGKFKDIDSGIAARSLAAMFASHIFWHNLISNYAPESEILEQEKDIQEIIRLFLYGITK